MWGFFQLTLCTFSVDDFPTLNYCYSPTQCSYKRHGKKVREDLLTQANRSKNKKVEDYDNE